MKTKENHKTIQSHTFNFFVWFTILLGGFFRFYNLNWDTGHYFHSDERNLAWAATRIKFFSHMNPEFFSYGSFPVYLYKAGADIISVATNDPSWKTDWAKITLVGRFFSAFFSTVTLFLIYKTARLISSPLTALLTLWFTVFMPLLIQTAHFSVTESMVTFWGVLLTYMSLRHLICPARFYPILSGLLFGLACATKLSATSLAIIPVISIVAFSKQKNSINIYARIIGHIIAFLIISSLVYIITSPYTFLDWSNFIKAIRFENRVVLGQDVWVYVYQFIGTTPYLFHLKQFFFTQGVLIGTLTPLGLLYVLYKAWKEKSGVLVLTFLWPITYLLYVGSWFTKFVRYIVPIYPFLALAAAILIADLRSNARLPARQEVTNKRITLLLIPLLLLHFLQSLAFMNIYTTEQTRVTASKWIYEYIPAGATILTEHWDEGLPIPLGENQTPTRYISKQLEIYQPDNNTKLTYYAAMLESADYVIINSRRLYGTLQHMTDRYPITSLYYKKLFDGSLGFAKVAQFSVYPTLYLGPWRMTLNDDAAEESFQVYDHPKALIFKNTGRFSPSRLLEILKI